ncbi:MAG: S41 family peptidase [Gemmatimonadota bacterium]
MVLMPIHLMMLLLAGGAGPSRLPIASDTLGRCADDLDRLVKKVEQNYAGFLLEVTGPGRAEFERHHARLRSRARAAVGDACFFVLRDLIDYFHDPHLFIYQNTDLDTGETARRAAAVQTVDLTEASARRDLDARQGRLDPLEGIWRDRGLRVAIVPARNGAKDRLLAVVLTADTSIWKPGAVRATFVRRDDGSYNGEVYEANYGRRIVRGEVYKRVLLRFSPGIWGKEYPVEEADRGLVDPSDAHRPTLLIRGRTVVLSIPSHDPSYKRALDSLIRENAAQLSTATKLILDLRGNEGGSSFMTNGLMPYVMSDSLRPSPLPDGPAVILSSEDQIRYATRSFASPGGVDSSPGLQRLLARMRANPGKLVPLADSLDPPDDEPRDSVRPGLRKVGLLVDRGTVSAAEAFLVRAMRSRRVTVFGEATGGALDYQSVSIVRFQASGKRWYFGYPTITARADLPKGGIKGRGVQPNIRIEWSREPDPIGRVERELDRVAWP